MKVKDYLEGHEWREVSFIIAKAVKDESTHFYHAEYRTSMLYNRFDDIPYGDYNILNDNAMPIDWLSGAAWGNAVRGGWAKCLLIISDEEILKLYKEEQAKSIIEFCGRNIR